MLTRIRESCTIFLVLILVNQAIDQAGSNNPISSVTFNGIPSQREHLELSNGPPIVNHGPTVGNEPYPDSSYPTNGSDKFTQSVTQCLGNGILRHENEGGLPFTCWILILFTVCLAVLGLIAIIVIFTI